MISENVKLSAFECMAKMFDGEVQHVYCKQLSIKCTVSGLGWLEVFREVSKWAPLVVNKLLKNSSYSSV